MRSFTWFCGLQISQLSKHERLLSLCNLLLSYIAVLLTMSMYEMILTAPLKRKWSMFWRWVYMNSVCGEARRRGSTDYQEYKSPLRCTCVHRFGWVMGFVGVKNMVAIVASSRVNCSLNFSKHSGQWVGVCVISQWDKCASWYVVVAVCLVPKKLHFFNKCLKPVHILMRQVPFLFYMSC